MAVKTYRALILDMDGTLLNSKQMVVDSLTQFGREHGIRLTPEQYRAGFGCTAETLMEELGLADPAAGADRWRAIMVDMLDSVGLFDGIPELLAAPIRRGVVTSQTREELACNIDRLGLESAFECTVTVDDTPYQKPHPRPLLYCLDRMGLARQEALFVGDSEYDYGCATAAGVDFGLATWGAENPAGFPDAAYHFADPAELLALVEQAATKNQ